MFTPLLFFLAVIFAIEAGDINDILANNLEIQKCMPTFKMFDASGKIPNGLLSGNLVDFGSFDQCLGIDEIKNKTEIIKTKYCVVKLTLQNGSMGNFLEFPKPEENVPEVERKMLIQGVDNSTGLILGWCILHTCDIYEFSTVFSSVLQEIDPELKVTPVMGGMCQTKDDLKYEYSTNSIILISFLVLTFLIMAMSTMYDMYIQHQKKKPAHIIFIAFSMKTNGQKLLSVSDHPDQLPCLHGIRFISMMWVVFCHKFSTTLLQPISNITSLKDWLKNPANMYILNAALSVDSFLVLSGTLLAYGFCLARNKGVEFNIILFYLHRYLRLTPVLAVLVWIHATIIDSFGSGPLWPFASGILKNFCVDYWWSPLVYAQNYYNYQQMCVGQSWYLAVDMQLYILSPLILIPLWKWPKPTLFASTALVLGSMGSSFAATYVNNLSAYSLASDGQDYMNNYYIRTHTRYGPWLIGLMLGYYLFKLKKKRDTRISLHPTQVASGWIVGMGLLLATSFTGHDLLLHQDKLGNSFFNGLHRHGWSLGLCWVIYACTQGYGGPINTFLSWSLFQILGRFTYTIYLVHFSIQFLIAGSRKTNTYFSDFQLMYTFWGDFMFAFAISVCLTLAYETPMITIEKVLFKTGHKSKKPELPVHNNHSTTEGGHTNNGFVGDENKQSRF